MRTQRKAAAAALIIAVSVSVALAGCGTVGTSGMHGSRSVIYESLDQLLADSSTVIVGTVIGQKNEGEGPTSHTVSSIKVEQTFSPAGLASSERFDTISPQEGDVIVVRQMGDSGMSEVPAPLLSNVGNYLLFLTPTMLDGPLADQFFVTGVSAGIYVASSGAGFSSLAQDGDRIPKEIQTSELK